MLRLIEGVCTAGGWSANDVAEPALRCRRRLCDDELPEQPAESFGLQGLQVKSQEAIPQGALLLVTDPHVGPGGEAQTLPAGQPPEAPVPSTEGQEPAADADDT